MMATQADSGNKNISIMSVTRLETLILCHRAPLKHGQHSEVLAVEGLLRLTNMTQVAAGVKTATGRISGAESAASQTTWLPTARRCSSGANGYKPANDTRPTRFSGCVRVRPAKTL